MHFKKLQKVNLQYHHINIYKFKGVPKTKTLQILKLVMTLHLL